MTMTHDSKNDILIMEAIKSGIDFICDACGSKLKVADIHEDNEKRLRVLISPCISPCDCMFDADSEWEDVYDHLDDFDFDDIDDLLGE